jgi:hypothetical protein
MNNIKLLGLTAGVGTLIFAGFATADVTGISWTYSSSGYGDTYLIYADVEAGDQLNAVFGDADNDLLVTTSGSFYQNAFGGATSADINPALIFAFASLAFDSWVTIGLSDQTGNEMFDIGIDFTDFEAGGAISSNNGSWLATPADAQVFEVGGQVLIGQFTVAEGEGVSGTLNFQGKDADLENWKTHQVDFNTLPAPGALALLGLAGIAARRRRK